MKKSVKTCIMILVSALIISGCSDSTQKVEESNEIKAENKNISTTELKQENRKIIISTDGSTQGLFKLNMSIDEVLKVIDDNDFEVIVNGDNGYISRSDYEYQNDNGSYEYDERGVLTLDKEVFNWDNSTYLLDVKGDIRFIFDENSELMSITLHHPFRVLSKSDVDSYMELNENNLLYEIIDKSKPFINLSSKPQDVIDVYGEPDEIIESDGLVNYYEYMINDEFYLEVLIDAKSQEFVYQINYTNYKPIEWVNKDNIKN